MNRLFTNFDPGVGSELTIFQSLQRCEQWFPLGLSQILQSRIKINVIDRLPDCEVNTKNLVFPRLGRVSDNHIL